MATAQVDVQAAQKELGELSGRLPQVQQYKSNFEQASQLMQQAQGALQQATQALGKAGGLAGAQMIGDFRPCASPVGFGRHGPMGRMQNRHEMVADMAERGAVQKAQQLTESATRLIMQAQGLASGMPHVPMEEVRRLGLVGMAPGMNNFLGDAVNRRQVQENLEAVKRMLQGVGQGLSWLQSSIQYAANDLANIQQRTSFLQGQLASAGGPAPAPVAAAPFKPY